MSEGYILVGIGEKYLRLCNQLVETLRKNGDDRPVKIITEVEHDDLYATCNTDFERGGTYPKINLDKYLEFDHNIFLDADMLCTYNTQQVWDLFLSNDQYIQQLGARRVPNFPGHQYEKELGHAVPYVHGGVVYINRNKLDPNFFPYMRDYIFPNYGKIYSRTPLVYKNSRPDQEIFAVATGKFGLQPINVWEVPVLTIVEEATQLPLEKVFFKRMYGRKLATPISFAHIFKGLEGVKKNITSGGEKVHLTHYENLYRLILNNG